MTESGETLRNTMRRWTTGVTVVTSMMDGIRHGMTVNSFSSLSLDPPYVSVTLDNRTRTHELVSKSGRFGVTILCAGQQALAERFAGRTPESQDRFGGLDTFEMVSGAPFIQGGLGYIDCEVAHTFAMVHSTLFVGRVLEARFTNHITPLLYLNRNFHKLGI